MSGKGTGHNIQ